MWLLLVLINFVGAEVTTSEPHDWIYVKHADNVFLPVDWDHDSFLEQKRCRYGECAYDLISIAPVVEGKQILFIHPRAKRATIIEKQVPVFLRHWGEVCNDSSELHEKLRGAKARENYVESYTGDVEVLEDDSKTMKWAEFLKKKDPNIIFMTLAIPKKVRTQIQWNKIFERMPKHIGCVMMVNPTERNNIARATNIKRARRAIEKTNSNCQIVSADEEVLNRGLAHSQEIFQRDGKLTPAGQEFWWKMTRYHLCSTDPQRDLAAKPFK